MVKIRPDEISSIIRRQIEQYNRDVKVVNVGTVCDGQTRYKYLMMIILGIRDCVSRTHGDTGLHLWENIYHHFKLGGIHDKKRTKTDI